MTNAQYWYLFWDVSIDWLNKLVREAQIINDRTKVEFYCSVIALKVLMKKNQVSLTSSPLVLKQEHGNSSIGSKAA